MVKSPVDLDHSSTNNQGLKPVCLEGGAIYNGQFSCTLTYIYDTVRVFQICMCLTLLRLTHRNHKALSL